MTREEAIKELEILKEDYWDDDGYGHETKQYDDTMLALDMAIEALEKEPTTKNDLALIHTEGLDEGIRCAMCTNSMKSDRGCDGGCVVNNAMYKKVMDVIENHIVDTNKMIEPTTKNDLGVDCIDRQAAITFVCKNTEEILKDTMPLEVKLSDDYLYENVAKIMRNPKVLPPVTPIRPKGHWIIMRDIYGDIVDAICSNCEHHGHHKWICCPNCGAKMESEVEE